MTYDPEVDAAYIALQRIGCGGVKYTYVTEPGIDTGMINLDFDGDGRLIGIEVLSASTSLPPQLLTNAKRP